MNLCLWRCFGSNLEAQFKSLFFRLPSVLQKAAPPAVSVSQVPPPEKKNKVEKVPTKAGPPPAASTVGSQHFSLKMESKTIT